MQNVSVNETFSTKSENSTVTPWENVNFYSLLFLTTQTEHSSFNELLVFVKSVLACCFLKLILRSGKCFAFHFDLLLMIICLQSVARKNLDACGFTLIWVCYLWILQSNEVSMWINFFFYYIATFILLAVAPSYFPLLAFTVDIYFFFNLLLVLFSRNRIRIVCLIFIIMVAFGLASYSGFLHSTPGPNMVEMNLIVAMYVVMRSIDATISKPFFRTLYDTLILGYCVYRKIKLHGVTDLDESSG